MRTASIGTIRNSSGTRTWILASGSLFFKRIIASERTSSTGSEVLVTFAVSLLIRVTESRFSTMFKSQLESSRIWRTSAFFSTSGRLLPFSRYTVLEPMMLVSGVRRSWEIARSRFARIFSFSASISIFSRSASTRACVFMLLVMALVMPEIENIATKVIG